MARNGREGPSAATTCIARKGLARVIEAHVGRPKVFPVILSLVCLLIVKSFTKENGCVTDAFHLSFAHRLVKSIQSGGNHEQLQQHQYSSVNPLLNPPENLIRPIECRNANNQSEVGICMFSIDCMQNKGVPLSICKHNYFVGTCCRLPDYNNFVGIVYDLRETETSAAASQALEARKGSSDALHIFKSESPATTAAAAAAAANRSAETSRPEASSTPEAQPLTSSTVGADTAGKYLISSTRLFGPTPTTTARPTTLEQRRGVDQSNSETARTADSNNNINNNQPSQLSFSSIGDEQSALIQNSTGINSAYELLAVAAPPALPANLSSAPQQPDRAPAGQQTLVISSSAHASTSTSQQLDDELSAELTSSAHSRKQQPSTTTLASSSGIYMVSQQASSTASTGASSSLSSVPDDQEFTVSSHSGDRPSSSEATVGEHSTKSTLAQSSAAPSQANSSPFVDLISSSLAATESPSETTTPFTSSLSTAILPSISSHPYAPTTTTTTTTTTTAAPTTTAGPTPTTAAPSSAAAVSPSSSQAPPTQQQSTPTLVSPSAASSASPSPASSTSGSPAPQEAGASSGQTVAGSSTTPIFVAQYYSTASAAPQPNEPHHSQHSQHAAHHRPLAGSPAANLQVASKIVTGNSAANNLIPGLSGLQSAILAHIPFKIASGLSSGLSSYLQAAMKPSAQSSGRPLISSNTAPALQYQQQQQQQQQHEQNQTKPASAQASAVRFPMPSSSSTSPAPSTSVAPRDVLKEAELVCGRPRVAELKTNKRVARIVGGNQSSFGQWPWMVSLRQWRKGAFLHKCGAALLNEHWAITAAHCVENVKAPDLLLRLGEFDVSNQNEPFPYIERRVKTVVSHPSFDPKTFEYDLALIRFTEPIQYERNIIPVCVPHGNDSYVDRMATVIGWGRLFEDGPLPDIIQHVDVPIITNQECEKMYKSAGFVEEIPDMFICAGISKGGRDSCEGDSGGPLTMVDHDGRSYLVGIISWGIGCALPSQPGVYTRITAFSPWINQIIAS